MKNNTMPKRNDAVLDFLAKRRSCPPKMLQAPGPDAQTLHELLTIAARVPDHGKLEPWRFIVMGRQTLDQLAPRLHAAMTAKGLSIERADKAASGLTSPVVVAVVSSTKQGTAIPEWEQLLSAGAVCLSLVNAALAAGYGAIWLSGFIATDDHFAQHHLGLTADERLAGLIHIGTQVIAPPERPRPDIHAITTWQP